MRWRGCPSGAQHFDMCITPSAPPWPHRVGTGGRARTPAPHYPHPSRPVRTRARDQQPALPARHSVGCPRAVAVGDALWGCPNLSRCGDALWGCPFGSSRSHPRECRDQLVWLLQVPPPPPSTAPARPRWPGGQRPGQRLARWPAAGPRGVLAACTRGMARGTYPGKADSDPGRVVDSSTSHVSQGARPEPWHVGVAPRFAVHMFPHA